MPLYEYEICAAGSGELLALITLPRPVEARDQVQLRRRTVPRQVNITGATADPASPSRQALSAYQRLERRLGNNAEFRRRIGHSPEAVKQAWSDPA